jgi:hypothetical protein
MAENNDADKAQEILERRDATGALVYDQVRKDPAGSGWLARRHDDHTTYDRVKE